MHGARKVVQIAFELIGMVRNPDNSSLISIHILGERSATGEHPKSVFRTVRNIAITVEDDIVQAVAGYETRGMDKTGIGQAILVIAIVERIIH